MSDQSCFVDRRTLISSLWTGCTAADSHCGEIASVLVQARPEHLAKVEEAIARLAGCAVHGRDARGKLVVVVDAPNASVLGSTLNTIAMTKGVLTAALVFHAVDAVASARPESAP